MTYLQLARRWQGYAACVRNHFLLKLQLVTKLYAVEALAPRSDPQSFRIPLSPYHLAAKSQTIMFAMLQAEGIAITSAFLLLCLVCVVAPAIILSLQSRLIKAAGHWQQHRASMFQARDHTLLSRTNTTAAELFHLRHIRSCAATAMGNKGGNPSPSTSLQISGASFIGKLLQSIWRHCYLTVFLPLDRLLQSISQMVRYYAKIAMKLIIVSSAMLRDMLTWPTPLELAACFHVANAHIHRYLYAPNKA